MNEELQKKLRAPFPESEIGKLPRLFCKDCKELSRQYRACGNHRMEKCRECGQKHSTGAMHLDYVGHAETTDRLLDVDPGWNWEPLVIGPTGPALDSLGGMWIRLTIGGTTRIGYGHAGDKKGGDAIKEVIGDAIRNAAMRFGVALDLWRKTDKAEMALPTDEPDPDVESHVRSEPAADVVLVIKKELADHAKSEGHDVAWLKGEFYTWSQGGELSDADLPTLTRFRASLIPEPTTRVRRSA